MVKNKYQIFETLRFPDRGDVSFEDAEHCFCFIKENDKKTFSYAENVNTLGEKIVNHYISNLRNSEGDFSLEQIKKFERIGLRLSYEPNFNKLTIGSHVLDPCLDFHESDMSLFEHSIGVEFKRLSKEREYTEILKNCNSFSWMDIN